MKGYVALTTVLVIMPLLLLAGIDSVYNNLTSLVVGKMNYDYQLLTAKKETCLEESIYRIKRNPNYQGGLLIEVDDWVCSSTVLDVEGQVGLKEISLELSNSNNIVVGTTKILNTNVNPFELSNI